MNKSTYKIVMASIFAAMIAAATFLVKIPSFLSTGGYVHIGESFLFLSAVALGPWYAAAASGIGSAAADLLSGYSIWAPSSFIIKALAALVLGLILQKNTGRLRLVIGIASAAIIIIAGYAVATYILVGPAAAVPSIWENLLQEAAGVVLFAALLPIWKRISGAKK